MTLSTVSPHLLTLRCCINTEASSAAINNHQVNAACVLHHKPPRLTVLSPSLHPCSLSLLAAIHCFTFLPNLFFLIFRFFAYFLFSMQIAIQSPSLQQSAGICSCCSFPQIHCREGRSFNRSFECLFETCLRLIIKPGVNSNPSRLY